MLELDGNELTDVSRLAFSALSALQSLNLQDNNIGTLSDAGMFCSSTSSSQIRILHLDNNAISMIPLVGHYQIIVLPPLCFFFQYGQHLDSRCVLLSDRSTSGAGVSTKTRLESSIHKFTQFLFILQALFDRCNSLTNLFFTASKCWLVTCALYIVRVKYIDLLSLDVQLGQRSPHCQNGTNIWACDVRCYRVSVRSPTTTPAKPGSAIQTINSHPMYE